MRKILLGKSGINLSIILSLSAITALCFLIFKVISGIDFGTLLLATGQSLETDGDGRTNFLIVGTGTESHDGADLTDTMMVLSLDQKKEMISMVSIPRDLHIKDDLTKAVRINEIYFYAKNLLKSKTEGMDHLKEKIEEFAGIEIQYYVKIDFDGFKKIIDVLGGIEVDVPEALYDPFYPRGNTIFYEIFSVQKGLQKMDGETALKYARSRKTTSDFNRSFRQQQIIYAIKEKALGTKLIFDKELLGELMSSIRENILTDLKIREMLTLGAMAEKYTKDKIVNKLLYDDPVQCGGFLYAPPLAEYGGAFVLIPAGGTKYIHLYFNLITNNQEAFGENLKMIILNGTPSSGLAAENKQIFQRYCLNPSRFTNATSKDIQQTTIYYKPLPLPKKDPSEETKYYDPHTIDLIKKIIPEAITSTEIPQEYKDMNYDRDYDIILEIGADYANSDHYLKDPFYPLYNIIYAPKIEETDQNGENEESTENQTETQPLTDPLTDE